MECRAGDGRRGAFRGEQNGKDEHLGKGEGQEGGQNYHPRGDRLERGDLGA